MVSKQLFSEVSMKVGVLEVTVESWYTELSSADIIGDSTLLVGSGSPTTSTSEIVPSVKLRRCV